MRGIPPKAESLPPSPQPLSRKGRGALSYPLCAPGGVQGSAWRIPDGKACFPVLARMTTVLRKDFQAINQWPASIGPKSIGFESIGFEDCAENPAHGNAFPYHGPTVPTVHGAPPCPSTRPSSWGPLRRMSRWTMEHDRKQCSMVFQTFQTFHSPSGAGTVATGDCPARIGLGLHPGAPVAIKAAGDWRRTSPSPTRSGPEGSSRNELRLGSFVQSPTFTFQNSRTKTDGDIAAPGRYPAPRHPSLVV
ncbi:hypothetical protein [Azospirillum doebereinerae]